MEFEDIKVHVKQIRFYLLFVNPNRYERAYVVGRTAKIRLCQTGLSRPL